jgi:glycosyltransferase involved in cell wall biosynthesis
MRELEPAIVKLQVFKQPGMHPSQVESRRRRRPEGYDGKLVLLSVGALSERKGHEYLIRAVAELRSEFPDLVCRIIGAGARREYLEALIKELELSGVVELLGKRPHADVLGEMSWCDVFVLASWGEAGGTVYGEAMQFGTPVVGCTGEGVAELVEDGEQGRLVPPRDVDRLAEAIRWLLSDDQRRERAGERARELAEAELSYPVIARSLADLYTTLVRSTPDSRPSSPSA